MKLLILISILFFAKFKYNNQYLLISRKRDKNYMHFHKNVLVILGLSQSKALTYILPILKSNKINKLYIIRNSPLPINDKRIININPLKCFNKVPLFSSIYKFFLIIFSILKYPIDLIYAIHMFPHGIIGWLISRLFKKKFVFHLIAYDAELYYWGKSFSNISKKVLIDADYLAINGIFNQIQINSENKKLGFLKQLNINFHKLFPGYSSVFPENFFPIEKEKKWDVITITRLYQIKRIDLFIEIIYRVSKRIAIKCVIIGDGPLLTELKRQVEFKGLSEKIYFLGSIPNNKINQYYNKAKIFLLTSENEGLPAVLIEAMLTKICTISSDVGLIPNLIEDGYNGFLYSIENYKKAEDIILKCLSDEILRTNIGNNSRKDALKMSAWNRVNIWNKLL